MDKLTVNFCGVEFKNPLVLPSGIYAAANAYLKAYENGASGITFKSLTVHKREGNPPPRVWKNEYNVINSVGLVNSGIAKGAGEIALFKKDHREIPLIASVYATRFSEFSLMVEKLVPASPDLIELNLSCPNVDDEFGKPLGMEKGAAGKIVGEVKKLSGKIPLLAKLSPNVNDIADIAKSCEGAGADGIVAINTVGPGMMIDIYKKKPVLGTKKGGVSGPGILPVAVRCVYEIFEAVKIPIIGMGGVLKWQDIVEMILAGATLVGVGSATYYKGMKVFDELNAGLTKYLADNSISELDDLIGAAHR